MRRDVVQKLVKGVAGTIESYCPILGIPSSCSARFGTPSTAMPSTLTSVTPDSLSTVISAAASQGDTTLTLTSGSTVTETESTTLTNVASPQTVNTAALSANLTYDVTVTFSLFLVSLSETCSGTITAVVVTDSDSITISSQSTSYTAQGAHLQTATLTSSGLNLLTIASGDIAGDLQRGGGGVICTATPRSTTVTRGRSYVLDGTTTLLEVVCDQDTGVATTLHIAEPLPEAVASGATLSGMRLAVSLTSDDTATIGECVVEWQATVVGVVHKWSTIAYVVERDATYTVTPTLLTQSSPYCRDHKPDSDTDFTELIDTAWRRYVEPALLAKALKPWRIVNGPHFEECHIAACEHHMAREFESDERRRAELKQEFTDSIARVLAASDLWIVDENEDLSAAPASGSTGVAVNAFDVCFVTR